MRDDFHKNEGFVANRVGGNVVILIVEGRHVGQQRKKRIL